MPFHRAFLFLHSIRTVRPFLRFQLARWAGFLVACFLSFNEVFALEFVPTGRSTIRLLAFGDSVVWGQGLHDNEKFYSLISHSLETIFGLPVEKQLIAHSGATIIPDSDPDNGSKHGEIPNTYPTIHQQVDSFEGSPDSVDLIIIDGGINDVGVTWIIDPLMPKEVISARSRRYCFVEMLGLLDRVTKKFRSATIVVTGYYPIFSVHTDRNELEALITIYGLLFGTFSDSVDNCRIFYQKSDQDIEEATVLTNENLVRRGDRARVAFAKSGFLSENAAFSPNSWLWGLNFDVGLFSLPEPVDPWAQFRGDACGLFDVKCYRASVCHPTPRGSRAYASAIASVLGFVWVDFSGTKGGNERMEFPFQSISQAIELVPTGGKVRMASGASAENVRITKSCKLEAYGGPVVIGALK